MLVDPKEVLRTAASVSVGMGELSAESVTPPTMRAAMMSTWGPVHADGPCVVANPEVLDAMLEALKMAVGEMEIWEWPEGHDGRRPAFLAACAAINKAEGGS